MNSIEVSRLLASPAELALYGIDPAAFGIEIPLPAMPITQPPTVTIDWRKVAMVGLGVAGVAVGLWAVFAIGKALLTAKVAAAAVAL